MKNDLKTLIKLDLEQGFSLYYTETCIAPISEMDAGYLNIIFTPKIFALYSHFLGFILVFLNQVFLITKSESVKSVISIIFCYMEHSRSTHLAEILRNSYQNSLFYLVQGWCASLAFPQARKYMEQCLILTGIDSNKTTVSSLFEHILTETEYISKIKGLNVEFMDGFLSSWMHLLCTFECQFPGVFSETISQMIPNIHVRNPDEILAFITGIHLTYIYERRYSLHAISDIVESHDTWKTIYILSNHKDERVCLACIDFVNEALPKKKFSVGMIYFVLQSSLKRIFELCQNPDKSSILHDALKDGLISLILNLLKEYQAVDVVVDFVFDSFYSVFSKKNQLNIINITSSNAACRLLFLRILDEYKVYSPNGSECPLSPGMIVNHLSRKITHYVPRNISKARRIHNEPEVLDVYERVPIIWQMYMLGAIDPSCHRYIFSLIQPISAALADWWNTPSKKSSKTSDFPIQSLTTRSIFTLYSMTNVLNEPSNSLSILIPFLKGNEISTLMYGFCGYIEHHFDLLVIGEKTEWLEHRLLNPLRDIVYNAFDEGRIPSDIGCFFQNKL